MNSGWRDVFIKEWRSDTRSRQGVMVSLLFSSLAVVACAFALREVKPDGDLAAGLLAVLLLFSAITTVPRIFLAEEEQGTLDLLRLSSLPGPAFTGKMLYACVQMLISGAVLVTLFLMLIPVPAARPAELALAVALACVALASGMSLCGALVIGAANRWILAGAVGMPLLLPMLTLAILALRYGFNDGRAAEGWQSLAGLAGFTLALAGIGPGLAPWLWGLHGRRS